MTDFKAGSDSQFEGGAPSLHGSARSEGTLPSKLNRALHRGRGALAPRRNARSEGNLPSKPNPGFPIEGGAPSLQGKHPERGHNEPKVRALETEPPSLRGDSPDVGAASLIGSG